MFVFSPVEPAEMVTQKEAADQKDGKKNSIQVPNSPAAVAAVGSCRGPPAALP